jgi:hypothetical protein
VTSVSRLALIAAVTAMIATSAFAQQFEGGAGDGTGNVLLPSIPSAIQNGKAAARHISQGKIAARRSGSHSFARVPGAASGANANSPDLTGGGSSGYNEMLLRD